MSPAELRAAFFDTPLLRRLHHALAAADPAAPPAALLLTPKSPDREVTRLGVFSGSFNPLTLAHTAVAARAHAAYNLDLTAFALSTITVDKEQVTGMRLDDRLLTLELYTRRRPGLGVFLLNQGLYVDQAAALHTAFPALRELYFVVGFDKIVQIFDPRYYTDRDAALDRLFALAAFIVAPRGPAGNDELRDLLARLENRPYADRVFPVDVPARHRDLSSTAVRTALEQGRIPRAGLPPESRACLQATGVYLPVRGTAVPPYALRESLLTVLRGLEQPLTLKETERLVNVLRRGGIRLQSLYGALDSAATFRSFLQG